MPKWSHQKGNKFFIAGEYSSEHALNTSFIFFRPRVLQVKFSIHLRGRHSINSANSACLSVFDNKTKQNIGNWSQQPAELLSPTYYTNDDQYCPQRHMFSGTKYHRCWLFVSSIQYFPVESTYVLNQYYPKNWQTSKYLRGSHIATLY